MKTLATFLALISGLVVQGCVTLTGIEKTDLSEVKPGTNRQAVEAVLGEPVETTETDFGLAAAYKYNSKELKSVLSDEYVAYFALMPYLWPFVEQDAREYKKEQEAFLTIIYDEQDLIASIFADNQVGNLLKAEKGDSAAQFILTSKTEQPVEKWRWLCRAANGGHSGAAYELYQIYHGVCGAVELNQIGALLWLNLASFSFEAEDQTITQIKYWGPRFQREILALRFEMTSDQIAEAERLVAEWEPNPAECDSIAATAQN